MTFRRKIDYAETVGAETDVAERYDAFVVGTAMSLKITHPFKNAHVLFLAAFPFQAN
jgi:hypothetical protein